MKIFWQSKNGTALPQNAKVFWYPFFPSIPREINPIPVNRLPPPALPCKVVNRIISPDKKRWRALVENALQTIRTGHLHKLVLARDLILECETPPNPFALLSSLQKKAQNATLFCFAEKDFAFLGASPERLFFRTGNLLESEAIAGTRKRGNTTQEDLALEKELLLSSKDFREFDWVRKFLQETISSLCLAPVSISKTQVLKTTNAQHLFSKIRGELRPNISDEMIVKKLHPTPALCGFPQESALRWLKENEPFERGYFGGVMGWSAPQASEWTVAIRCCLIEGRFVHLTTGAGIVEGSDPEKEWEELDIKAELFSNLFL